MTAYEEFLAAKRRHDPATGLTDLPELPAALFPFQRDIVRWALRRGLAAIFASTGTGKSFMELAWGQAVHAATGGNILLLTPLAVAAQMVREATKFGVPAKHCATQAEVEPGITVTNYAMLHHFDLTQFVGETVLTPFMGIGSEVYCAVEAGRKGVGFELKDSYWRQSVANMQAIIGRLMSDLAG